MQQMPHGPLASATANSQAPRHLAALIAACAVMLAPAAAYAGSHRVAHASRVLDGNATAHLHLVKPEGSELIEEGAVSGALAGSVRATLHTGATFTASFTIYTHDGAITGHGQATPHGTGRYQSFGGTFQATHGTGRYAHISGHAGLYGVFDRRTDAVTIQTTGSLSY
jgi:hypothetical protein